jgi:hypothetical protein
MRELTLADTSIETAISPQQPTTFMTSKSGIAPPMK